MRYSKPGMSETLDTRGLLCPLPVIRTQDAIKHLTNGTKLEVLASDPGTLHDIPAWCPVHAHELSHCEESEGELRFMIIVNKTEAV